MEIDVTSVLQRLDWERQHVALGGEILDPDADVVRLKAPDGTHHVIIWSALTPANADQVIDREVDRHRRLGVSFEWKVYAHDEPGDLRHRLAARGFEIGDRESVMMSHAVQAGTQNDTDPSPLVSPSPPPPLSPSLLPPSMPPIRVQCVRTKEQVALFKQVAEEVFGGDWSFTAGSLLAEIEAGGVGHRGYIGYLDEEPASVGRLYVHPESWFGGLYGGGTRPAFRGRGAYRAVVAARARDAIQWGAKYLMVDARETSRGILQRMGFTEVGQTWPCVIKHQ